MQRQTTIVCKTWKTKTLAALLATVAAVALPQLFHLIGLLTDLGAAPGETFLPMHIAIFLVGFFAGAWSGLAAGALSPLLSFLLTSLWGTPMPALGMLPFMVIELSVYGLTSGLLAERLPVLAALLIAQIAGRGVRAIAILIGAFGFHGGLPVSVIWMSVVAGLPGLMLQWVLVPLAVAWVRKRDA